MSELTREQCEAIKTVTFIGYIMMTTGCSNADALDLMAKLCAATQEACGLGHADLPAQVTH